MTQSPNKPQHALVVGGTGMLAGVVKHLARFEGTVSVIARNRSRLDQLVTSVQNLPGRIVPISVDYTRTSELREALAATIREMGHLSLTVCWIHNTAPKALDVIGETMLSQGNESRLFHLLGSASANPTLPETPPPKWSGRQVAYRRIFLGFKIEDNRSRWLTDSEIVEGVLEAVSKDHKQSVVGTVEPWERRP